MTNDVERSAFAAMSFTTRGADSAHLVRLALQLVEGITQPRILDLGCGGGSVAVAAVRMRPEISAVALDISPTNVAAARAAADRFGLGARVATICEDYMAWSGEQFDLIISDSVLYIIEGADTALASRLVSNLRPGGVLMATLPISSIGNLLRSSVRRLWRTLPPGADRLAFALARRMYSDFPPEALADRVPYLRMLPVRLAGPRLREIFAAHGLELTAELRWESRSLAKLEHHLFIWRRR
jgi:trans-aconitate 2-methyltransferase